jgi:hypothetical protein
MDDNESEYASMQEYCDMANQLGTVMDRIGFLKGDIDVIKKQLVRKNAKKKH